MFFNRLLSVLNQIDSLDKGAFLSFINVFMLIFFYYFFRPNMLVKFDLIHCNLLFILEKTFETFCSYLF